MFDVDNNEHLVAYAMLNYHGRQHPTLRFFLEEPYTNVLHMMQSKIVEKVCQLANVLDKAKQTSDQLKSERRKIAKIAE
jgi:hypothetical protein